MKNKIAILYSGFMPEYLDYFIDICSEKNIKIDLLFFENNKIFNNKINTLLMLKTKYKPKNIKLLFLLEKEIRNIINIEDYDYILSDCIGLSFGCNIFHYTSLCNKINVSNNNIIKFFSHITHYKKLILERYQFKNSPKSIFVSNTLKDDYINNCNVNKNKSYIIYPGFNYEVKNINKVKNEDFTIGLVACGFSTKGGYTLVKAFKILKCNFKINKIKLKIINPKYKKYSILAFYIKILNLSKYIEFLPYQNDMSNFYNSIINVSENVLIPRPETEYLVEKTVKYAKKFNHKINIIDLGTGSGCIAIALKKELDSEVSAIDISKDALDLAKLNARKNNVDINFYDIDITKPLKNMYDIIISNPPYIPKDGYVAENVLKYEPHIALFADDEGIYFYKKIIKNNLNKLNKNGFMAFEIGDNEDKLLEDFLKEEGITNYKFATDLTGRIRYLFIFNE